MLMSVRHVRQIILIIQWLSNAAGSSALQFTTRQPSTLISVAPSGEPVASPLVFPCRPTTRGICSIVRRGNSAATGHARPRPSFGSHHHALIAVELGTKNDQRRGANIPDVSGVGRNPGIKLPADVRLAHDSSDMRESFRAPRLCACAQEAADDFDHRCLNCVATISSNARGWVINLFAIAKSFRPFTASSVIVGS